MKMIKTMRDAEYAQV